MKKHGNGWVMWVCGVCVGWITNTYYCWTAGLLCVLLYAVGGVGGRVTYGLLYCCCWILLYVRNAVHLGRVSGFVGR